MIKVNLKSVSDHLIEMYEIFTTEKNTFGNVIRGVLEKGKYDNEYNKTKIQNYLMMFDELYTQILNTPKSVFAY